MKSEKEGFIKVSGGKVWYKIAGKKSNNIPLLIIHGGPGSTHYYLEPLEDLSDERQVIFYDQLGCGKSDRPNDTSLWTIKSFLDELEEVIRFLKLKEYHILGQSWGAALGASFALKKPKGLKKLILANPYLSTPLWVKDAKGLIKLLPKANQKSIAKYQKDGIKTKEYKKAYKNFYYNFVRRYKRAPSFSVKSRQETGKEVYKFMWGPAEFLPTGELKDFDLSPELSNIKVPVLLICGRFDESTPKTTKYFAKLIKGSKVKIFEKSAHLPHITERKEYMREIKKFLTNSTNLV